MGIRTTHYDGFTLIELIIVISILGILAFVAIPRLFPISMDAQTAMTNSIASALSSANAENYAVRIENIINGNRVTNCKSVSNLLEGGLPSGYTIKSKSVKANITASCTLRGPSSTTATFNATGIP